MYQSITMGPDSANDIGPAEDETLQCLWVILIY